MPSTGLRGPYTLDTQTIDAVVHGVGPGAYVLGRKTPTGYDVNYVGRSDNDLANRLKQWALEGKHPEFQYRFFSTAQAAFEKECELFHSLRRGKGLFDVHPSRPSGSTWKCPRCES